MKKSKHNPALPLYTFDEAQNSLQYFKPVQVGATVQLSPEISFRFVRAAHILGSCMAEVSLHTNGQTRRLLFTGDIGRVRDHKVAPGKVVHSGPQEGETADLVVMESTYGNRMHPNEDPRPELASTDHGTRRTRRDASSFPLSPSSAHRNLFSCSKELIESGQIPRMPVFCDSPMAIKAVEIFLKHDEEYSDETRAMIRKYGSPLEWPGFTFASTPEESKRINESHMPSIIISSSGMVTGGRILHHLAQRLPDPRNLVLFIGFQAPGTRGFAIKSESQRSEDLRRICAHSRRGGRSRAVQRSCRPARTVAMAPHFQQSSRDNLPCPRRTRCFGPVARPDEKRTRLECPDSAVSGEG